MSIIYSKHEGADGMSFHAMAHTRDISGPIIAVILGPTDGLSSSSTTYISPQLARRLAAELVACADALEPATMGRAA